MAHFPDTDCLNKAISGDALAFEELVKQHYDMVYRCAFRCCGNKEDAEDVTQDVFMKIAGKLSSFNREATFSTWLYRVTVNCARDLLRKRSRSLTVSYENGLHSQNHQEKDPKRDEEILKAIATLKTGMREAVILVYGEGLSHKQAADILKCAETTVSWRIYRAKKILRTLLS